MRYNMGIMDAETGEIKRIVQSFDSMGLAFQRATSATWGYVRPAGTYICVEDTETGKVWYWQSPSIRREWK